MVALLGVGVFAVVCGAVQFLRTDYNPLGMPLSFYVIGPYGRVVEGSFFVLAVGLAALGAGWYRALGHSARSVAPLLLFMLSALALCVTAAEFTDVPGQPPTVHGDIHVIASAVAFLSVTFAMLLQAWWMRLDPRWHPHSRSALVVAAVAFVALWAYALIISVASIPRGLGEKVVIVLILIWLWRAAWWLVRAPPIKPVAPPAPHHGAPRTP
ncbi:MAG: DUF998 domain-containing protein [Rhodanobacteraceae bacterium]